MKIYGTEAAFPRLLIGDEYEGINTRTWLTGQALSGLCANTDYMNAAGQWWVENPSSAKDPLELLVRAAVNVADATLAELKKK